MEDAFSSAATRTRMLLGQKALDTLAKSRVAVIGLGGVGGHCAEALARAGIGTLLLIDKDVVEQSNLNRQLIATKSTLGMPKVQAMQRRIADVSECTTEGLQAFVLPDNVDALLTGTLHFIVDAVDTVTAKLCIAAWAQQHGVPIISCMGTGNRLDPSALYITDIYETESCPLARAMRKGCREYGITRLPVVMSREAPIPCVTLEEDGRIPGSAPFVPASAGLLLASYVVRTLIG